jgi:hypothetical protein
MSKESVSKVMKRTYSLSDKAKEYSDLKSKNVAENPNDYPAYRAVKAPFLQKIEQEVYEWYGKTHRLFYIEIEATKFLYWCSKLTGTGGNAKAAAFYPFLLTTNKIHPKMRPYFINHELIHFAQQREMLVVGAWVFRVLERLYVFFGKNKRGMDLYLYRSTEQEAYDNMFDLDYLEKRKHYTHLKKYWNNKPVVWKEYLKKVLETEGFPIIYEWHDKPGTVYENHAHQGKVSFYVLEGSVRLFGGIQKVISTGERFDVPVEIEHSAIVLESGCEYIVGQEIEGDA